MTRKKNKSDFYQHKIVEISVDPSILGDFSIGDGLGGFMNEAKHSEKYEELRENLLKEIYKIIKNDLTERQSEVVFLWLQSYTQTQIAEMLNIHQTTVHKLLKGNIDYANNKKRYGGAIKKLQKLCEKNDRIIEIIKKIDGLKKVV